MSIKAAAVVLAGGMGTRMNAALPKQFMKLADKPVLQWSLECFDRTSDIGRIVLVLPEEWLEEGKKILSSFKPVKDFVITVGGKQRQDSVFNGLMAVGDDYELVVIHDAARPGINPEAIEEGLKLASEKGNAVFAIPSYDTLAKVVDGEIVGGADRNEIFRIQTPQIFPRELLVQAIEQARKNGEVGTDESTLVRKLGKKIYIASGSENFMKITTADDLKLAEFLLTKR